MPHYVALLGGINLGNRRLKMDALAAHFQALGCDDVQTLLASGNVLFRAAHQNTGKLEVRIEQHLAESLGYPVATYVRSAAEIHALLEVTSKITRKAAATLNVQVLFFKEPLSKSVAKQVIACSTPTERLVVAERELLWLLPGKMSESVVWKSPELKAVGLPTGTMRNLNTVEKLGARFHVP